jgi:hypothetical protein
MHIEEGLRAIFLIGNLVFVIWTLVCWAKFRGLREFRVRDRVGETALLVGSISAGLLTGVYLYLLIAPDCLLCFGPGYFWYGTVPSGVLSRAGGDGGDTK